MKKLLAMLGATGLVVSTGAILVSCNEKTTPPEAEPTELTKTVDVTEPIEVTTVEMGGVITNDDAATTITGVELKEGSTLSEDGKTLNITLLISEGVIAGEYKSEIIADKAKPPVSREGEDTKVHIPFEFTVKANLSTVIKVTELGELKDTKLPTITAAITTANTTGTKAAPDFGTLAFKEGVDPTETAATMVSDKFDGEVVVTYTIKVESELPSIDEVIKTKNIGEIADNKDATIIAEIKAKNTGLDKDAVITITEPTTTTAKATVEGYEGTADIIFTITKPAIDDVIKTKNIGEIADNKDATIIAEIKAKNTGLDKDAVITITEPTTTTAKATVEGYEGTADIIFTITKPAEETPGEGGDTL